MPKTYSQIEKTNIVRELRRAAGDALFKYGVKRTSVDYLVEEVHIPKGTFYLFYPSKEALFFDVYITFFKETEEHYLEKLQELDENKIVTNLTKIFSDIVFDFYQKGIYRFFNDENNAIIMRKISDEDKINSADEVNNMVEKILAYFFIDDKADIARFISALQAILYSLPLAHKLPNMKQALILLIRGLVLQLVGE